MTDKSQRPMGQEDTLSSLNAAIDALNIAKEASRIIPAKAVFNSTNALLIAIRVGFLQVHVGRLLADVYRT